jgi:general secretion pathway protein A
VAGHSAELPFDRKALKRIHQLARGVPRRINLLCARALLGAWANGLHRVDRKVVDKAALEVFGPENKRTSGAGLNTSTYAFGAGALLCVAMFAGYLAWRGEPQGRAAVGAKGLVAPVTTPAASMPSSPLLAASQPATPPVPRAIEELEALLPQMPTELDTAWRELSPGWKLPASAGDPCVAAALQQLQCYRAVNLTVPTLRQLARPGILTLRLGNGPAVYAQLIGLSEQTATLRVGSNLHTVRLPALGRLWRGDFATYWRPPQGYSAELADGNRGQAIQHLAVQLSRVDGAPPPGPSTEPLILDASLRSRVQAFQRAQGLKPDGLPGPMTFMQLDSATGENEPRLQTQLP